ncbi:MAG: 4-hydroxythreonine-4-phosphate dehydrogenase PdxA, partial [Bacteroidaceae bacterium]|nr:4-hydroxythreonine-4-phosphate dehydrogenase PdxA [Bacteroidaceae bacterium]
MIRVAITHGDINGVGYEVIFKTFEDPTMLELCTPIIYGSPKIASYHRKVLDIQTPYVIINNIDD